MPVQAAASGKSTGSSFGDPDKVAALEKRANELAATMTKPLLLEAEFKAMKERLSLSPALPDEDVIFGGEDHRNNA